MPRKPAQSSAWSKDIAYQFGNQIPVICKLPQGATTHHFSFQGLAKDYELAQSMAYFSKKFSSPTEIIRAALHIGLHILYHMTKIDDPAYREQAGKIVHLSSTMEQTFYKANVMDSLIKDLDYMKHCVKLGLMSQEDFDASLANLYQEVEQRFDKDFVKNMEHSIQELKLGKSAANLRTCKTHGGLRVLD